MRLIEGEGRPVTPATDLLQRASIFPAGCGWMQGELVK